MFGGEGLNNTLEYWLELANVNLGDENSINPNRSSGINILMELSCDNSIQSKLGFNRKFIELLQRKINP